MSSCHLVPTSFSCRFLISGASRVCLACCFSQNHALFQTCLPTEDGLGRGRMQGRRRTGVASHRLASRRHSKRGRRVRCASSNPCKMKNLRNPDPLPLRRLPAASCSLIQISSMHQRERERKRERRERDESCILSQQLPQREQRQASQARKPFAPISCGSVYTDERGRSTQKSKNSRRESCTYGSSTGGVSGVRDESRRQMR